MNHPPIEALLGGLDPLFLAMALAFVALDVLTGYAQAIATKTIDSTKMRTGFWHKLAIILALLLAALLDVAANGGLELGFSVPLFNSACIYVVLMEVTSIIENIKAMNPELAGSKLMQLFEKHSNDE